MRKNRESYEARLTAEESPPAIAPAVSVIVPVYNVEPYLHRCVDSLTGQTLTDIEIILVDDGSTDGCGRICDEYAAADPRVRVVHQENVGLSEARNAGIDRARADYLMFVDSDDWVEPDFCRIPFELAVKQRADLVIFQFRKRRNGKELRRHYSIAEGPKTQEEALDIILRGAAMTAWNKLYHRDLFRKNRYPKGRVYEDAFLTPVLVHEARHIFYSSAVLYNLEYREGSITTVLSDSHARDWLDSRSTTAQNLKNWGYAARAESYYLKCMLIFVSNKWQSPQFADDCIRYLRSIKRLPPHFPFKQRCKYYLCISLCRITPKLYRLVCRCWQRLF